MCGSDKSNRKMCTETDLENDHSEETRRWNCKVKMELVILLPVSGSFEQGNEHSRSIKYAECRDCFATFNFLRRTLRQGLI